MEKQPIPKIEELKRLTLFQEMSDKEINSIRGLISLNRYSKDEFIINEDEPGDSFFILLKGSVYVVKKIDSSRQEVLNLIEKPGDLFGEMSLVEDKPRSAGIVATENSEVLSIDKEDFLSLVNNFPKFTLEVAKNISNYLRQTDQKLIGVLKEKNEELQEAYSQLKEAQDELLRNERLSLVGRMASAILHDIKNPIATISGYAQILKSREYPQEKVVKFADIIDKEVSRFSTMVQEFLSFARGEGEMKQSKVNLAHFLHETIDSIRNKFADRQMNIESDFKYEGYVFIDESRMRRAIENIVNNSIDAMKKGGVFKIETSAAGSAAKIILSDDGHGMTDEIKSNIFKEFYSFGKSAGTGLGLAIAKKIIDEHGGKISVESEPGEGTKFIIELPPVIKK